MLEHEIDMEIASRLDVRTTRDGTEVDSQDIPCPRDRGGPPRGWCKGRRENREVLGQREHEAVELGSTTRDRPELGKRDVDTGRLDVDGASTTEFIITHRITTHRTNKFGSPRDNRQEAVIAVNSREIRKEELDPDRRIYQAGLCGDFRDG